MEKLILSLALAGRKMAQRAELMITAVVVAIVFMLVLPMPIWLLDLLIAVNLCMSGLIVVVSMYMATPTAFSTFPAVLLLTTLFRLAIAVSTTRLILLEADAGHIVETFGNFVVGGNIVVGLVIFLILTVVQFIVITKGSERVSEVTARFTLDAMPGKQMSIDSDLRAGLISADDAKRKRVELQMESQMHGAMDGAMKFVKGDAIAGIFIVLVNLVGGIAIGIIQRGMSAGEAVQVYSVLTIGDALIQQIPGLLISLTAGMITTRVSHDSDHAPGTPEAAAAATNVGREIVRELLGEPKALVTAAGIMVVFAAVPGMPWLVFLSLALLLVGAGYVGMQAPQIKSKQESEGKTRTDATVPAFKDVTSFRSTRPMQLVMPSSMKDTPAGESLSMALRSQRNKIILERGIPDFPALEMVYSATLPEGTVQFCMVEVPQLTSQVRSGWGATNEALEQLHELGFHDAELDAVEGSRRKRCWVNLEQSAALIEAGVQWSTWEEVFAADVENELLRNCQMFMGVQEASRFMDWAESLLPELGKELARCVPLPRIAEIVQRLAREGVSLRNVRQLMEAILEWSQKERDPDVICDHVRLAMRRQLCHQVANDGLISVVLLSPEVEETIRSSIRRTAMGDYLDIDPALEQSMLDQIGALCGTGGSRKAQPVLVTTGDIRRQVRKLVEEEFFSLSVMAFPELSQHYRVQPVGMLEM